MTPTTRNYGIKTILMNYDFIPKVLICDLSLKVNMMHNEKREEPDIGTQESLADANGSILHSNIASATGRLDGCITGQSVDSRCLQNVQSAVQ